MNGYRGVVFGSVTMISLIYNIIIEFLSTRLAYPVFTLLDELDKTPGIAVHMLYDIACLLESHLQRSNLVYYEFPCNLLSLFLQTVMFQKWFYVCVCVVLLFLLHIEIYIQFHNDIKMTISQVKNCRIRLFMVGRFMFH